MFLIGPSVSRSPPRQALRKWGFAVVAASCVVTAAVWAAGSSSGSQVDLQSGPVVAWADLPAPAQQTESLIRSGGPFPYQKDGTVFGNRERLLPLKSRGFYREYTVATPGSADRGARRIVCGGAQPVQPEACFYTADHYASFRRIVK